jgi:hypothetical protein
MKSSGVSLPRAKRGIFNEIIKFSMEVVAQIYHKE